ncbi:tyrosine-type recombinase/integrase [Arcanobacterium haemolyticum]|nr:tyrosine-type recombinase/integrase [Arcanobacterium haemolyticum]
MNNTTTQTILSDWTLAMRAQALSDLTIHERIRVSNCLCEYVDATPVTITTDQIIEWVSLLPSAVTKWTYFTHIKALFTWLEITRRRTDNPLLGLKAPRRPKYYPRPISLEVIEHVLNQRLYRKTRCMILLAFNCGLRVGEICKVRGQDYDRQAGLLTVEGKGGKRSIIPVNSALQPFFNTMPAHGWWFPCRNGGHVRSRSVGDTIVRTFRRYEVHMVSHQLRHTFATELLAADVDLRIVQLLMRHESIQTTALYTRVARAQQLEGTNKLPVFLGKE